MWTDGEAVYNTSMETRWNHKRTYALGTVQAEYVTSVTQKVVGKGDGGEIVEGPGLEACISLIAERLTQ
jgi:hypothetical protein